MSIANISQALLKAQRNMGNATKGASNPFFKSRYADLNAVREAVLPSLNENGITVLQLMVPGLTNPVTGEMKEYLRTLLLHESGEMLSSDTEIVCAKRNDPQSYGSAVSYARRYGLQAMLCIGAEDDDGEKGMARGSKPVEEVKAASAAFTRTSKKAGGL